MNHSRAVRRFQRQADLSHNFHGFVWRQFAFLHQQLPQIAAFHKLHGDVLHAVDFG